VTVAILALVVGFVAGLGTEVLRERRAGQYALVAITSELEGVYVRLSRLIRQNNWDDVVYEPLSRRAWDSWGPAAGSLLTRSELAVVAGAYHFISSLNGVAHKVAPIGSGPRLTQLAPDWYVDHIAAISDATEIVTVASERSWWKPRRRSKEAQLREVHARMRRASEEFWDKKQEGWETQQESSEDRKRDEPPSR
jgi:hypothetical protein